MENNFLNESPQLIVTEDGSNSLHFNSVGESYHSVHGAMLEAEHVYLNPNFCKKSLSQKCVNVLEVGFGTGLNAFLTLCKSAELGVEVNYTSLEAYPLSAEIYEKLNYPEVYKKLFPQTPSFDVDELFVKLQTSLWNEQVQLLPNFCLTKLKGFLQETELPENTFDSVYYDAFAPQYQPELWTADIFAKVAKAMKAGAILTTYCCKGDVKRALKANNLKISKIQGFAGKREMLVAEKV